jgi:hypothetical protein
MIVDLNTVPTFFHVDGRGSPARGSTRFEGVCGNIG